MRCARSVAGFGLLFILSASAVLGQAEPGRRGAIIAITEENDLLANPFGGHQDRHYTQGAKLTVMGGDDDFTNITVTLNRWFPQWGIQSQAANFGVVFGQNIYTPEDYSLPDPDPTDRPYAGWLYGGWVFQRRGQTAAGLPVMENFEIDLGVVGSWSFAQEAQRAVHQWREFGIPQGWHHQLKNEPGLLLKYDRRWRLAPPERWADYMDVIPHTGGNLGNVKILADLGVTARLGFALPDDFGIPIIDSPVSPTGGLRADGPWFSGYVFADVTGRAVAQNIFLDGNTFRGGPSVEREPFVADLSCGVALQAGHHVELNYTYVHRSREFAGQKGNDRFGSMTLKIEFAF